MLPACVTDTAVSKVREKHAVRMSTDRCTTVSQMIRRASRSWNPRWRSDPGIALSIASSVARRFNVPDEEG